MSRNFSRDIRNNISIVIGEHICHTIPYQLIQKIVMSKDFTNEKLKFLCSALGIKDKATIKELESLLNNKDELLKQLNNAPSNLRAANASTNMSISGGIDFPIAVIKYMSFKDYKNLSCKAGNKIEKEYEWDWNVKPHITLNDNEEVFVVNDLLNEQLLDLIDSMAIGQEFHIYTYTDNNGIVKVQSSDDKNVKTKNVNVGRTPIILTLDKGFVMLEMD